MKRCIECGWLIGKGQMAKHRKNDCKRTCGCVGEERCDVCIQPEDIAEVVRNV